MLVVFVFEKLSTSFRGLLRRNESSERNEGNETNENAAMKYNSTHYVGITMQSTQKKVSVK